MIIFLFFIRKAKNQKLGINFYLVEKRQLSTTNVAQMQHSKNTR